MEELGITEDWAMVDPIIHDKLIAKEKELILLEQIELQAIMPGPPSLKYLWKYGSIQFGYICFFLLSFPPAAIIGVIMNVFHINLIYYSFTSIIQRKDSVERNSIGVWNQIFFAMTFIALIINIGILIFSSDGFQQFISDKLNENYDAYTIVVILVVIEHIAFIFKFVLSALICYSPTWVKRRLQVRRIKKMMDQDKLRKKYALNKIKKKKHENRKTVAGLITNKLDFDDGEQYSDEDNDAENPSNYGSNRTNSDAFQSRDNSAGKKKETQGLLESMLRKKMPKKSGFAEDKSDSEQDEESEGSIH